MSLCNSHCLVAIGPKEGIHNFLGNSLEHNDANLSYYLMKLLVMFNNHVPGVALGKGVTENGPWLNGIVLAKSKSVTTDPSYNSWSPE